LTSSLHFFYLKPTISFYEECSVQIIIEYPFITDKERESRFYFLSFTRYPMSSAGRNNILIVLRFDSLERSTDKALNYPLELFFHFIGSNNNVTDTDSELSLGQNVFPNFIVCRHCKDKQDLQC